MKKGILILVKTMVIVSLCFLGIFGVHFMFVLGVDAARERALVRHCETYAKENQIELIASVNAFTYEEETEYAVCRIQDMYEKLVFINHKNELVLYRNARSYQPLDVYDGGDPKQSLSLSLHQNMPVYVYKKISRDRIYVAYYSFDTRALLFEIDSEE